MHWKTVLICIITLMLRSALCISQTSLKCYTAPKIKARWTIGIRTGISREFQDDFYFDDINSKNRSWTQILFLQRNLGKKFMLELHSMHQRSWKDIIAYTEPIPGRVYNSILNKNHRLHTNLVLHYLLPEEIERIRTGIGLGIGILTSRVQLLETYMQSGQSFHQTKTNYEFETPNIIAALTTSYRIKKNLSISAQLGYSTLLTSEISHLNINAGLEYQLSSGLK